MRMMNRANFIFMAMAILLAQSTRFSLSISKFFAWVNKIDSFELNGYIVF